MANRRFGLYFVYLRHMHGLPLNYKRIDLIYHALELRLPINLQRCFKGDQLEPLDVPKLVHITWLIDFMHDCLGDGCGLHGFNVLNNYTWEGLKLK